jgi:hypothetical protein
MKAVLALIAIIAGVVTADKAVYNRYVDLVNEVNSKQSLWTAELNTQILDGDYTTIKNLLGSLEAGQESTLPEKTLGWNVDAKALPVSFMPSEKWPECKASFETVHDQSACVCFYHLLFSVCWRSRSLFPPRFTSDYSV